MRYCEVSFKPRPRPSNHDSGKVWDTFFVAFHHLRARAPYRTANGSCLSKLFGFILSSSDLVHNSLIHRFSHNRPSSLVRESACFAPPACNLGMIPNNRHRALHREICRRYIATIPQTMLKILLTLHHRPKRRHNRCMHRCIPLPAERH